MDLGDIVHQTRVVGGGGLQMGALLAGYAALVDRHATRKMTRNITAAASAAVGAGIFATEPTVEGALKGGVSALIAYAVSTAMYPP